MSNLPSRTRSLRKPADKVDDLNGVDRSSTQSPSRLPVKGATSTRPRPLSLSSTTSLLSNVSSGPASASMRPPPSRANISKPASSTTGLYRTTSTRRPSPPAASTETAPVKKDRPTSISSLAGLQRASSTRRPNAQLPAGDVDPTKVERSTQASTRHLRSGSVHSTLTSTTSRVPPHTRTKSSSTVLSASAAAPPTRTKEETSSRGPLAESQQLKKPAFNTLQQHYSPAKNLAPKPHPAAFLVPPTPSKRPENIAISAETAKLQSELLQLHLLHKEAARTEKEWRISAKRKLGRKFDDVVKEHDNLVRLEEEEMGRINAAALKKWGVGSWGLEEKTQALESVLSGVWNMGEPGGKYTRVVRKFARWVAKVQDILSSRDKNDLEEVSFIEELDSAWKNDCVMLRRKLEGWSSQLRDLGTPDEGSSLATVVRGCRQLVEGMLDELGVMAQIERDAVRIEGEWIQAMNDDNTDDEDVDRKLRTPGAAWRAR